MPETARLRRMNIALRQPVTLDQFLEWAEAEDRGSAAPRGFTVSANPSSQRPLPGIDRRGRLPHDQDL